MELESYSGKGSPALTMRMRWSVKESRISGTSTFGIWQDVQSFAAPGMRGQDDLR